MGALEDDTRREPAAFVKAVAHAHASDVFQLFTSADTCFSEVVHEKTCRPRLGKDVGLCWWIAVGWMDVEFDVDIVVVWALIEIWRYNTAIHE